MSPAASGPKLIVITGGPGSGKTTLVEALGERGYPTVPEAAIQVIAELNEELGLEQQKRWRLADPVAFQRRVFARQLEHERGIDGALGELVFLDRGLLDGLGYLRHFGQELPPDLEEAARVVRYDAVFFLDTLTDFVQREGTGRMSGRTDSLAIGERILEVYRERGYDVVRVPELSVADRMAWVLGRV